MSKQSSSTSPSPQSTRIHEQQKINSYIINEISIDQCKSQIMKNLQKIKQKIDIMEQQLKISNINNNGQQQNSLPKFVKKFKNDIKFLLGQFEVMKKVVSRIEKEIYEKHQLSKQILIKTIRQQLLRFQHMIPKYLQQQVQKSRLKFRSQQSSSSINSAKSETDNKITTITTKDSLEVQKLPEDNLKIQRTKSETQTILENQQIISDLKQFLIRASQQVSIEDFIKISQKSQQIEIQQQSQSDTENIKVTEMPINQQQSLRYSKMSAASQRQQQEQQKKLYKKFIQREKQDKPSVKIAKRVALSILVIGFIVFILACVAVYKIVGVLTREF